MSAELTLTLAGPVLGMVYRPDTCRAIHAMMGWSHGGHADWECGRIALPIFATGSTRVTYLKKGMVLVRWPDGDPEVLTRDEARELFTITDEELEL